MVTTIFFFSVLGPKIEEVKGYKPFIQQGQRLTNDEEEEEGQVPS